MTAAEALKQRIDRALEEVKAIHPGAKVIDQSSLGASFPMPNYWIEYSFYGSELHMYVWGREERRTVAHYRDVVDDLEAELTHPAKLRNR